MKATKNILALLLVLLASTPLFAQRPYYDALQLKEIFAHNPLTAADMKAATGILANYVNDPSSEQAVKSQLTGNPFLPASYIGAAYMFSTTSVNANKSSFFSNIGSTNVTNIADGLAKFLVERGKEELNVAFFRKFSEFIKKYPEATTLFPTTALFLKTISAYQYSAMLPALKEGFHKDLNALSANLLMLRKLTSAANCGDPECITRIDAMNVFIKTVAGRSIIGALVVTDNMVKGKNGAEVIENLAGDAAFTPTAAANDDNLSNAAQFANLISQSLRSDESGKTWISKEQAEGLVKNEAAFKIFLGLVYANDQKADLNGHHIRFQTGGATTTLAVAMTNLNTNWATLSAVFKSNFLKLAAAGSTASESAANIISAQKQSDPPSATAYESYAAALTEFLKLAVSFPEVMPTVNAAALQTDISETVNKLDFAINVINDIKSKNYNSLVLHSSEVLDWLFGSNYTFKNGYIKYGTFMANVVQAKNSDDVKTAIEAAVLPVGSSSIKRETSLNVALNAFLGAYAGFEYMPALKEHQNAFSAGLTAPVGIALSWGKKHFPHLEKAANNPGGKSYSLFISLIDIGAVAAYRFADDQTNIASDIELRNIVSPGLFFYLGLGKCPVSIGAGAQIGPQLRGIEAGAINDKTDNVYIRYGLSVVVDIPLFNLYTESKD